jgi:hypothetical protein
MKYVLLHDFSFFKKRLLKWFIVYLIFICLFTSYFDYAKSLDKTFFLVNIGLKFDKTAHIQILIFALHLCFYLYITVSLFYSNIKMGIDNIFNRIDKKKYLWFKFISLALHIMIISFISVMLTYLFYRFNNISIENLMSIIVFNFLIIICYSITVILFTEFVIYNKIWAIIYGVFTFFLLYNNIQFYKLIGNAYFVIFLILFIFVFVFSSFKTLIRTFERSL